jgi:hypothetical protein
MNIGVARSELNTPPRIKLSVLVYESIAILIVSIGMVLLLG